jgi:hypothetical protein
LNGLSLPVESQPDRIGSVPDLRGDVSPATVSRLVVSAEVDSVDRSALRPFTHVCQESVERSVPALAHSDSARAVRRVILIVRLRTPSLDPHPSSVRVTDVSTSLVPVPECRLKHDPYSSDLIHPCIAINFSRSSSHRLAYTNKLPLRGSSLIRISGPPPLVASSELGAGSRTRM